MNENEPPPLDRGRILGAFERYEVRYVLVGGLAAQAYGALRVTKDLDVCPEWSERNLQLLASALRELGGRYKNVAEHLRLPPDARLIAGQAIGAWRTFAGDIDVLNGIPRQRTPRRMATLPAAARGVRLARDRRSGDIRRLAGRDHPLQRNRRPTKGPRSTA